MATKPLRKIMEPAEIQMFLGAAGKDLQNVEIHAYEKHYFWTGQKKPEGDEA